MLLCPSMVDTNSCLLYALIGRKSTDLPYAVSDFFLVFFSSLWLVGWFTECCRCGFFLLGVGLTMTVDYDYDCFHGEAELSALG